jgi:hypothetical protein
MKKNPNDAHPEVRAENVRSVRVGHGANCSSLGSVIDTLFATAVAGTALFAAVVAALSKEPATVAPQSAHPQDPDQQGGRST